MMGRDLQIETEVEKDNERSVYSEVKKPYRAFLDENWDAMKKFYEKNPQLIFKPLTIEGDTAFHIAAYSERIKLLRCFLGLVPNSRLSEVFLSKNCHGNSTLHEVASTDNIEAAELLISKLQMAGDLESTASRNINQVTLKELLEDRNQLGETPLYRSAALGKPKMLKFLAKRVGNIKDHFQRNDTVSILHIAVFGQHYDIAIWLLEKDKELGKRKTASGMTCLHVLAKMSSAFKSSSHEDNIIKTLLYHCLPQHLYDRDDEDEDDKDDGSSDGHEAGVRDLESELSSKNPRVTKTHPSAISRIYNAMWRTAAKEWPSIEKVWKRRRTNKSALKLTKLLVQMDTTWEKSFIVEDKTLFLGSVDSLDDVFIDVEGGKGGKSSTSSTSTTATVGEGKSSGSGSEQEPYTPLLIAATEGIVEIVHEILQHHPQAIEHLSKDEENILHVAISHRQIKVFKYLKKMDVILRCRLVSRLNVRGYTILHQVADIKNSREGNETGGGGPAFVLSEELKWFERVQKMMPAHYTLHRDNDGRTASELFREQHAPLLKEAKKWLKDTIGSCTTVAILVAGVVFAAGYSVPGGTDESGVPRSLHSPIYMAFTITDTIALVSSLISVVMFLMITSSPLEQEYFHYKIPRKLMIGFSFLFFSMILAMISFSASLLLILRFDQKRSWTQTVIYAVALLPICLFGIFQFPLYASLTRTLHYLHKTITKKILPQAFLPHKSLKKGKRKSY